MARTHLYRPLEDEQGNLFSYATVEIRNASGALIAGPVYADATSSLTVTNPVVLVPAVLDVWLDDAQRVDIVVHPGARDPIIIHAIDVMPAAEEVLWADNAIQVTGVGSPGDPLTFEGGGTTTFDPSATGKHNHDGEGRASTDLSDINTGINRALGDDATVVGQLSTAYTDSTVVGTLSIPNGISKALQSTIVGKGSQTVDNGVVVGEGITTTGTGSTTVAWPGAASGGINETVVGKNTGAGSADNATLVGSAQTITTTPDIVRLGEGHGAGAGAGSVEIGAGNASLSVAQPGAISGSTQGVALGIPLAFTDVWGAASVNRPTGLDQGINDSTWHPAILALQGTNSVASADFHANGNVSVGWHPYGTLTSALVGLFGSGGAAKTHQTDTATIPALTSLVKALANLGIIWDKGTAIVSDTFQRPDLTDVGYAETGQASEWWADSGRNDAVQILGAKAEALGTAPAPGALRVYDARQNDVTVKGVFGYSSSAGTPPQANAEYIGLLFRVAHTGTALNGYLAGRLGLFKVTNYALTSLGTYSTAPVTNDVLTVEAHGTTITVKVNGSSVLSVTDATYQNQYKHGYSLSGASTCTLFQVFPWT